MSAPIRTVLRHQKELLSKSATPSILTKISPTEKKEYEFCSRRDAVSVKLKTLLTRFETCTDTLITCAEP